MEYRQLGETGIDLSVITYGTFGIGGTMWGGTDKEEAMAAIEVSLANGVTTIDTAPFYGLGLSEELVGDVLKGKDRSKIQILTKFGMVWDGSNRGRGEYMFNVDNNGINYPVYKYAGQSNVIKEAEESLKRLKTDYIDLLQLHWSDASTPIEETMEALQTLIDQGKIRAAGVSNYTAPQMQEAQQSIRLASNQVPFSMLKRSINEEIVPFAIKNHVGIIAYSPLERGLLTGKFFHGEKLKGDDHRNSYFSQFNLSKVETFLKKLENLAKEKKVTIAQLVLKWTSMQPGITVVLAGATNGKQAIENAESINVEISASEMTFINTELSNI